MCARYLATLVAMAAVLIAGCHAPSAGSPIPNYDGAELYRDHCASCHGRTGAGDGPLTGQLKVAPTDLRTLSSRNDGRFPSLTVRRQIDGRDLLVAHGSREMPVWGQFFRADSDKRDPDEQARARMDALIGHLVRIQQN